ncbi:MAG: hypothetical protein M5U01_18250 [Ardenticatenaceae bacterium]|nr:hypothetical protein [Ardenticatenaceae bacterium]
MDTHRSDRPWSRLVLRLLLLLLSVAATVALPLAAAGASSAEPPAARRDPVAARPASPFELIRPRSAGAEAARIARTRPAALTGSTAAAPQAGTRIYLPIVRQPNRNAPTIASFSAAPATIDPGGTSTLSWSVIGATGLTISPGVGAVSGTSVTVSPRQRTEYTLTATNAAGTATARTVVDVRSGTGGDDGGVLWLPFFSADGTPLHTYGTSLAVDGAGGIHVTYSIWIGDDAGRRPAYYAYCPAACTDKNHWAQTRLGDGVQDVRLALDPAGHPRLLLYTSHPEDLLHDYQYAACDSGCTDSARWTITTVATSEDIGAGRSNQVDRYFALDPQGRPRFIYHDGAGDHFGTFYAACDSSCTLAGRWSEVLLTQEWLWTPSLTFTATGEPRFAAHFLRSDPDSVSKLVYIECDATCKRTAGVVLVDLGGFPSFSLRLDASNRPRIAVFTSNVPPWDQTPPDTLFYLSCNTACADPEANLWNHHTLAFARPVDGGLDLILDRANRPRIAYQAGGYGLAYAWCNANCETEDTGWQSKIVEPSTAIDWPVLPTHDCTVSVWFIGRRPALALDPAGNPRIASDAEHWWGGSETRPPYGLCDFTDVTLARLALFKQP